jgi:hypothetical protein
LGHVGTFADVYPCNLSSGVQGVAICRDLKSEVVKGDNMVLSDMIKTMQKQDCSEAEWMYHLWKWADGYKIPDLYFCEEESCWYGLPRDPCRLRLFRELNLKCAGVKELPVQIGELTQLTHLNLTWGYALKQIPSTIGQLENLVMLNLAGNKLKIFPKEIGNLASLEELNLLSNRLCTLPKEIGKLKNLKKLTLMLNPIEKLPSSMTRMQNLRRLDITMKDYMEFVDADDNINTLYDFKLLKENYRVKKGNLPEDLEKKKEAIQLKINIVSQ